MRLLFIAPANNTHTHRWVSALKARGHKMLIFSPVPGVVRGVKVVVGKRKPDISWLPIDMGIFGTFVQFRQLLSMYRPDIIHIHYIPHHWANLFFHYGIKNLIISVWGRDVVYDLGKEPWSSRVYKRLILRKARVICATSEFLRDATRKYVPASREIRVIPFGVDTNQFQRKKPYPKVVKHGRIRIGFVKHLLPKYGPEILLKAFKEISQAYEKVELLYVGRGFLEDTLKKKTVEFGLQDKVKFAGAVPHEEVPKILEGIDIFVMPSRYESETFGVAALEAQAMEIPVVASRVGGVPEAIQDGVTGFLVPPGDPAALARSIRALLEDPDLRIEMGRRGREFVKKKYEWENNVKAMEQTYSRVLAGRRTFSTT